MHLLSNPEQLQVSMAKPDRLTDSEKQLWQLITRQNPPST
jgi:hypothetical protein